MGRVLVTGGAGFIGSHLCERLLKDGFEVVCLDNFDPFYDPAIKWANLNEVSRCATSRSFQLVQGDIRDMGFLQTLFRGTTFDLVVHLAARAGVRPSIQQPLLYHEVNVRGTLNLLELCRTCGIKNFIFGSS